MVKNVKLKIKKRTEDIKRKTCYQEAILVQENISLLMNGHTKVTIQGPTEKDPKKHTVASHMKDHQEEKSRRKVIEVILSEKIVIVKDQRRRHSKWTVEGPEKDLIRTKNGVDMTLKTEYQCPKVVKTHETGQGRNKETAGPSTGRGATVQAQIAT